MGCVVNGPGESKHANIGISLPGTFEDPVAPVYVDGKLITPARRPDRRRVPPYSGYYVAQRYAVEPAMQTVG